MRRHSVLLALFAGALASTAGAQEIVVQNDTLVGGGNAGVCPCFAAGEEVAVWLTTPCAGEIVGVQFFWRSFFGGAPQTIEEAFYIHSEGTFPVPGFIKNQTNGQPAEFLGPVMTDGGLNEFRFVDDQMTIPIRVPVSAGETFVVSFEFFNANENDLFAGTLVTDANGVVPNRNAVKVNGVTWTSNTQLGLSGDWVIRAIVNCMGDPTGACCMPDGSCMDGLTESACNQMNGFWNGSGSLCSEVACVGACYIDATDQCLQFDKATCDAVAGVWFGPGTTECDVACPGDLTTTGAAEGQPGYGEPDGTTNLSDLLYFVNEWNADLGSPSPNPMSIADVTTTGSSMGDPGFGTPDGDVDLSDLLFYVNEWNAGLAECP